MSYLLPAAVLVFPALFLAVKVAPLLAQRRKWKTAVAAVVAVGAVEA